MAIITRRLVQTAPMTAGRFFSADCSFTGGLICGSRLRYVRGGRRGLVSCSPTGGIKEEAEKEKVIILSRPCSTRQSKQVPELRNGQH